MRYEVYRVLRVRSGSRETAASYPSIILIDSSMFWPDDIRQALAGMHKRFSVKPPKDSSEREAKSGLKRQMELELTRRSFRIDFRMPGTLAYPFRTLFQLRKCDRSTAAQRPLIYHSAQTAESGREVTPLLLFSIFRLAMFSRSVLLLLFPLLFFVSRAQQLTAANYPTLQARISLPGLDFFSRVGHNIVDAEIPQIEYPFISLPIDGGPGHGYVNVTDLKIPKFVSPKFDFKLAPPNGLTWRSHDGVVKVTGKWSAEYTIVVPIFISGTVEVLASDIRSMLSASIYAKDRHPQLDVGECNAEVKNMDISIGGGVIPWIVNLFRGPLSTTIKRVIRDQFCVTTRTVLLKEANDALLSLPTHFSLGKGLFMDYGLINNPFSTPTYVQGNAYIDVMIGNRTCDLPVVPFPKDKIKEDRMINVWVSETIPNCLFDSAHSEKLIHFVVNKNMSSELGTLLKTSCHFWEACIGRFFPLLSKKYPDRYLDLIFRSKEAPWLNVSSEGVELESDFVVDVHLAPYDKNPTVLAQLELSTNLTVIPFVSNNRVVANVSDDQIDLYQVFSTIGDFSERILSLLKTILRPLIKVTAGTALHVGIPIPTIDNVTISGEDARIALSETAVRVDADFLYVDKLY